MLVLLAIVIIVGVLGGVGLYVYTNPPTDLSTDSGNSEEIDGAVEELDRIEPLPTDNVTISVSSCGGNCGSPTCGAAQGGSCGCRR